MDHKKIIEYICELNQKNKDLYILYKEILNYKKDHFIPAVDFETALFLKFITSIIKPKRILEIGFGSGVSAIFTHMGNPGVETFISLERDENRFNRGIDLLKKYRINNINIKNIDAFTYLKSMAPDFDFIFLDAQKRDYHQYLSHLKYIIKNQGIFICDNISFNGKVVESNLDKKYKDGVKYIKIFNKMIVEDNSFETIFIPIGDGISFSIRK